MWVLLDLVDFSVKKLYNYTTMKSVGVTDTVNTQQPTNRQGAKI